MRLTVIGLGKLGSPLAVLLAAKGHEVTGIDFSEDIVEKINHRKAPFNEPKLQDYLNQDPLNLQATTEYEPAIHNSEATFIIVPTPSDPNGEFTNRYILRAVEEVGKAISKKDGYHLVVITSTVMPGSLDGEIKRTLEKASERKVGPELGLCYSPLFIALGSVIHNMLHPDMVLIGESDPKGGEILQAIYEGFCENNPSIERMNWVNAELTKLSLNTYVTMKISYANMLANVCEALPESDVDVVTKAIGQDSRIGKKYLKGGLPFGGPCFPRDNVAFRALARNLEVSVDLAKATQKINDNQISHLEETIRKYAGDNARIGILGLSYKSGTNVTDESPGIHLANRLVNKGYPVTTYDPEALHEGDDIHIASSLQNCLDSSDIAIIMTDCTEFKKIDKEMTTSCEYIIDCWRILDKELFQESCQIIYLGQGKGALNCLIKTN